MNGPAAGLVNEEEFIQYLTMKIRAWLNLDGNRSD
jgi:hypothetical protein